MIAILTTLAVVAHTLLGCCAHEAHEPAKTQATGCCGHDHAPPADAPPANDDHDCSHATCVWLATDDAPEISPLLQSPDAFALGEGSSVGAHFSAEFSRRTTTGDSMAQSLRLHLALGVLLI